MHQHNKSCLPSCRVHSGVYKCDAEVIACRPVGSSSRTLALGFDLFGKAGHYAGVKLAERLLLPPGNLIIFDTTPVSSLYEL